MKIIFADIILLWMRILTCVEYPKTSKQSCILHGSVFVFLYIITVESSSLSYAFQHFQSCSVLSPAEVIISNLYTRRMVCLEYLNDFLAFALSSHL